MRQQSHPEPALSTSRHLTVYIIVNLLGCIAGAALFWAAAVMLARLGILESHWTIPLIVGGFLLGAYLPKYVFARRNPALCPSCGGAAYLKWPSRPILYQCTACGHTEDARIRLGK